MTFLCIGHRGASGHAPENTLKAFELAIEMGCPWIELDVYVVDGQLVVIHDDELDRTTNGSGLVMDQSFEALRKLDAGDGEKIPTLKEVIELVNHRAVINIELKGAGTAEPLNQLLAGYLTRGWLADEFFISSFNHRELEKSDPAYRRGALFYKAVDSYTNRCKALQVASLNLAASLVTKEVVDTAHSEGLQVFVYTVNTHDEMLALKNMGVDGVFTNYPDQFPSDQA